MAIAIGIHDIVRVTHREYRDCATDDFDTVEVRCESNAEVVFYFPAGTGKPIADAISAAIGKRDG